MGSEPPSSLPDPPDMDSRVRRPWRDVVDDFRAPAPSTQGQPRGYGTGGRWFSAGLKRQPLGALAALLAGWTNLWFALVAGVITAAGLALLALVVVFSSRVVFGAQTAVSFVAVLSAIGSGFVAGLTAVYGHTLLGAPIRLLISLACGVLLAALIVAVIAALEPALLRVRGFRRLSRREAAYLTPIIDEVCSRMQLTRRPAFMAWDHPVTGAWTHTQTIVLSTGLGLYEGNETLTQDELAGIIAHELHHWATGDAVGLLVVWALAWPVAVLYNLGVALSGGPGPLEQIANQADPRAGQIMQGLFAAFAWFFIWPAAVLLRLVVGPAVGVNSRRAEYDADAAALAAGYGESLSEALVQLAAFEPARTGWESVLNSAHPPIELRLEALEPMP